MWGISWNNLMTMIADLPYYDYKKSGKEVKEGDPLEDIEDFEKFLL